MTFVKSLYASSQMIEYWKFEVKFHKSDKCVSFDLIFSKKANEGAYKYLLLNCTMNKHVC